MVLMLKRMATRWSRAARTPNAQLTVECWLADEDAGER
jgi:hypothetical protein